MVRIYANQIARPPVPYDLCIGVSNTVNSLVLDKSCLNDLGYSEEFCENLLDHDAENTEVQNAVAQFSVYESIVDHLIPILFSFFLGSWSDNFGRKYLLYLFFFFCLVNTSKFTDYESFSNHC